ncbi:hypothetical protein F2P81_015911 [Scophthalmus maximus]|uniref:Uncharacterized protein n=1 Tax=Scophthalmus maximus TaxID=52904 RepID=A0A6A4S822_SCOMX|nr:hypothetical protein F2P81_015911 [Scophthalmus maximus]
MPFSRTAAQPPLAQLTERSKRFASSLGVAEYCCANWSNSASTTCEVNYGNVNPDQLIKRFILLKPPHHKLGIGRSSSYKCFQVNQFTYDRIRCEHRNVNDVMIYCRTVEFFDCRTDNHQLQRNRFLNRCHFICSLNDALFTEVSVNNV